MQFLFALDCLNTVICSGRYILLLNLDRLLFSYNSIFNWSESMEYYLSSEYRENYQNHFQFRQFFGTTGCFNNCIATLKMFLYTLLTNLLLHQEMLPYIDKITPPDDIKCSLTTSVEHKNHIK